MGRLLVVPPPPPPPTTTASNGRYRPWLDDVAQIHLQRPAIAIPLVQREARGAQVDPEVTFDTVISRRRPRAGQDRVPVTARRTRQACGASFPLTRRPDNPADVQYLPITEPEQQIPAVIDDCGVYPGSVSSVSSVSSIAASKASRARFTSATHRAFRPALTNSWRSNFTIPPGDQVNAVCFSIRQRDDEPVWVRLLYVSDANSWFTLRSSGASFCTTKQLNQFGI